MWEEACVPEKTQGEHANSTDDLVNYQYWYKPYIGWWFNKLFKNYVNFQKLILAKVRV